MTIINSTIKKLSKSEKTNVLQAKFFYPKLVIFEDVTTFRILDLEEKKEDLTEREQLYKMSEEITDSALQDHFLWIALKSGQFLVTDLLNGSQIKIIVNNYSNLKFQQANTNSFYFKSDSGEYLKAPYSTMELTKIISEGQCEHDISLKKFNISQEDSKPYGATDANGLMYYIEAGSLICQCPLTGFKETLLCQVPLSHALAWGDHIILADKSKMWIMDINNMNILFEFECNKSNFLPVMVYNNTFYYLEDYDQEVILFD